MLRLESSNNGLKIAGVLGSRWPVAKLISRAPSVCSRARRRIYVLFLRNDIYTQQDAERCAQILEASQAIEALHTFGLGLDWGVPEWYLGPGAYPNLKPHIVANKRTPVLTSKILLQNLQTGS